MFVWRVALCRDPIGASRKAGRNAPLPWEISLLEKCVAKIETLPYARNENAFLRKRIHTFKEAAMIIKILIGACIGLFGGVASGFFGIGGGVVMVPAFMYFFAMDIKKAIGTSLLIIVPTAIVGATNYIRKGNVSWEMFLIVAAFAIVGGFVGSVVAQRLDSDLLARMFGGLLILVGILLIWQGPLNQFSPR